jgi:hypothetical protein
MTIERRTHTRPNGLVVTLNVPAELPPSADGVPTVTVRTSPTSRAVPSSPVVGPTADEVAKLPRAAREAFAERTALREAANRPDATAIRRDFDRLVLLVHANGWTDDTPVPQDVFGPL